MSNKVLSTTNYSRFKYMEGNRHVNNGRVRKLIGSIKRKNLLSHFPIVCMKNCTGLYIMDGQHRFNAAKELGLPIYYVEAKNIDISDVAATNSAQKGWVPKDFIQSFAEQGYEPYKELLTFIEEHGLGVAISMGLLSGQLSEGGYGAQLVREGKFVVKEAAFANRVAAGVKACARFFNSYTDRGFVMAIARLMMVKGFTITRFIQKLEYQSTKMVKCASWGQYVDLIEEIYNHKVRGNDIIPLAVEVRKQLSK